MNIKAIKTHKVTTKDTDILKVIDRYVPTLSENSILVVTSKIVSLCEGSVVPLDSTDKESLVISQADKYLPKETNTFHVTVTLKDKILAVNAGVDESNTIDGYVLWPKDPQQSANMIREHLVEKHKIKNVGVLITDSKTTPLRYGITGIGISHSGFLALNNYVGTPDIFGRILKMTQVGVMDGIASAAVVCMGEGANQTPLAVVTDIPFVQFQDRNPTDEELSLLAIDPQTDVYGVLLQSAPWKKGGNSK